MTSSEDKEINNETRRGRPAGSSRPSGQDPENRKTDPEHCLNDHPSLAAELKQLFHGITAFPVEMEQPDSIAKGDTREINEVIGDFRLIRKIGTGGMARVFEAEQISLKRRVALKVLFSHLSLSDKAICKFQREAEAGARQQHPGIIAIFAAGEHNGLHYIVEELVQDGRTLADELMQLKKEKGDSIGYFREVARLFAQTADALAHAHASGVIHRDVKPTNILITPEGMPKITDFGLARITDALILSRTGEYSGTPFYMSPEQAGSGHKEIDSRSDIFSLGITLYEALTFMRPFNGRTSFEIIKEIVHHEPRNPIKENRSVPRDLATICLKALEKEPDCRYLSMQEFADDLRSFLSGLPILARPSGPVRTTMKLLRHHKFLSISLASACMTLVAFSIVLYQAYRHQQDQEAGMAMMFQPVHQALGWSARDLSSLKSTENWLRNTAPENPDTSLLMAIRRLEENRDNRRKRKESLMEAMDHLRYATGKYKEQGEQPLLGDCRYLMGVASLRLAQEPDVSVIDRDRLRAEGEDALEKANDAAGPDSLVWRASTEKDQGFPSPIRLNTEHTLAHLYRGVDLFEDLYQGGKRSAFDETSHYLEKVLESRPHNITALFCLGRLYFFWARTYQSYELLDPATDLLERAILEASESSSYYMIPVTLGQIELLKGNDKKAETYFQLALEQIRYNDGHIHNIYCNLGKIAASRGEWEKAHEQFRLALEQRPDDPHVNIELGECFLLQGDPAAAMPYGLAAEKQSVAGAFLLTARICMARKDYATAVRKLKTIAEPKKVIPSAYDRALASLLVGVVPPGNYGIEGGAKTVALKLAESACYLAKPQLPPICLSAMGVADLLNASYSTAIEMLLKARETRNGWGQSIRSAHGWEDACDLFFLAMAHTLRSRTAAAQPDDLERAAEYQRQGESLYNQLYNEKMELADLVKAVCTRSRSLSSD